jgi:glycine oxidase
MSKTWDVAIAGGGIIGGAIAFELARRGVSVIVLEKRVPGTEASWAAAGMLSPTPHSAHDIPLLPLLSASAAIFPEFVAAVESASGKRALFQQVGALEALFASDAEREMNTLLALHHGLGLQTDPIPLAQAFELEPALSREVRAAALRDLEGCVDNRALTSTVLAAAAASGAEFRSDSPVEEIIVAEGCCTGVIAGGEKISARHVVIAAGCFSKQIEGVASYAPVRPVRGQMVAIRSDHVDLKHVLRSEKCYIVPRANGICVVGSTLENVGFVKRVTPDGIAKILNGALEMVPGLGDAEVIETWSGLRPDTPDHLPSLGKTDVEGLIIATGHFRNGILLTPITARLVAAWITGERIAISCDAFSPMRFVNSPK